MIRPDPLLISSLLFLAVVAWLIARAVRQNAVFVRIGAAAAPVGRVLPTLTVIVPARNESANIAGCVRSLLAQQYPAERLRFAVVDDDSQDDTAAIAAAVTRDDARASLLCAPPLPPGWKGKVHACWYAVQAMPADTEWLCFLDADMRAHPLALATAVQLAEAGALDLLSLAPRHELGSFAERLIIPCGLYVLGFSIDRVRIQAPESDDALCTGQFMLLRRRAYEQVGGYAMVRNSIAEDLDFARLIKRRGLRVRLEDGSAVLATRMYTGWNTLWPGFAKNLVDMLGGRWRTLFIAASAVTLSWCAVLLPLLDLAACHAGRQGGCVAAIPALLAAAAAFGLHLAGARHFGIPWWYGLAFPIGYAAGALIALDSIRRRVFHQVEWKGRTYA
ncbi:MAG: glycosyltransferase [Gammaproteobacteria bacterium]|nr:glycosyltransferase [Gammaproteobacteria bacterium]MBV8308663.1 glycosyltransferase [Gammaproteobacteria bacterium]